MTLEQFIARTQAAVISRWDVEEAFENFSRRNPGWEKHEALMIELERWLNPGAVDLEQNLEIIYSLARQVKHEH